jgi:hypothetical protein
MRTLTWGIICILATLGSVLMCYLVQAYKLQEILTLAWSLGAMWYLWWHKRRMGF